ncbi:amino acid permease [Streptomyces sp. NPDC001508]|uniref:amino acid permease n=1 Tax=Streptomyces sp. NPDC001508 TaxID=3154656 RepID=UPI00331FB1A0
MPDTHHSGAAGQGESDITRFGYQETLERRTGRFASFAVAFAFVSIATGIFTAYGSMLSSSGPMGIWTWPIVVVGQLAVALVFGALCARIPVTGYAYQWMSRLANPVLGWALGWVSFTFLAIAAVAVDYTIASGVLPALFAYHSTAGNDWAVTAVVLLAQALLVAYSTKWSERVNSTAVTAELLSMVALVALLLVVAAIRHRLTTGNLFSTGAIAAHGYFGFGSWGHAGPWMLGFLLGAFTIVGFESACNLAEETHQPETVVPRAMVKAVLASGVLGFLFLVAVTMAGGNPAALARSGSPIADVIITVLGSTAGTALLGSVALSIFACGLVIMITGVRLIWAMSRDERFPGWRAWRQINASTHTPRNAAVLFLVVTEVILGVFASQTHALFNLFAAATLLPAIIYTAVVLLYLLRRRKLPAARGFCLGRFELPVVVFALIWLLFELSIFRDAAFADPWLYCAVTAGSGLAYLGWLLRRRGRHGLQMPEMRSIDDALTGGPGRTGGSTL